MSRFVPHIAGVGLRGRRSPSPAKRARRKSKRKLAAGKKNPKRGKKAHRLRLPAPQSKNARTARTSTLRATPCAARRAVPPPRRARRRNVKTALTASANRGAVPVLTTAGWRAGSNSHRRLPRAGPMKPQTARLSSIHQPHPQPPDGDAPHRDREHHQHPRMDQIGRHKTVERGIAYQLHTVIQRVDLRDRAQHHGEL
jgi:hypothetical protein